MTDFSKLQLHEKEKMGIIQDPNNNEREGKYLMLKDEIIRRFRENFVEPFCNDKKNDCMVSRGVKD